MFACEVFTRCSSKQRVVSARITSVLPIYYLIFEASLWPVPCINCHFLDEDSMAAKFWPVIIYLPLTWTLILFLTTSTRANVTCSENGTAFMINVRYEWNRESDAAFPDQDPTNSAVFRPMVCVSHSKDFVLWENSEPAIPELVQFFENASQYPSVDIDPFKPLDDLFKSRNSSNGNTTDSQTVERNTINTRDIFRQTNVSLPDILENKQSGANFESTTDPQGTLNITVKVDPKRPLISCFAMIWPSADWFVGISNINVCDANNAFVLNDTTLFSYDAGIYDAPDYTAGSKAEKEIMQLYIQRVRIVAPEGYGSLNVTEYSKINERTENVSNPACFPADELVTLRSGRVVRMEQLELDHEVALPSLVDSRHGSRVFSFSHRDPYVLARFLSIRFLHSNGVERYLRLTPGHYIYRWQQGSSVVSDQSTKSNIEAVPASILRIGDVLVGAAGDHPVVLSVNETISRGLYNPHTVHGDIIIKGIRVSCYTTAVPPVMASAVLFPFRVLYYLNFGRLSSSLLEYLATLCRRIGAERLFSMSR